MKTTHKIIMGVLSILLISSLIVNFNLNSKVTTLKKEKQEQIDKYNSCSSDLSMVKMRLNLKETGSINGN